MLSVQKDAVFCSSCTSRAWCTDCLLRTSFSAAAALAAVSRSVRVVTCQLIANFLHRERGASSKAMQLGADKQGQESTTIALRQPFRQQVTIGRRRQATLKGSLNQACGQGSERDSSLKVICTAPLSGKHGMNASVGQIPVEGSSRKCFASSPGESQAVTDSALRKCRLQSEGLAMLPFPDAPVTNTLCWAADTVIVLTRSAEVFEVPGR